MLSEEDAKPLRRITSSSERDNWHQPGLPQALTLTIVVAGNGWVVLPHSGRWV